METGVRQGRQVEPDASCIICMTLKITSDPQRHASYMERYHRKKLQQDLATVDDLRSLTNEKLKNFLRSFNIGLPKKKNKTHFVEALMQEWTLSQKYRHDKPFRTNTAGRKKLKRVLKNTIRNKRKTSASITSNKRRKKNTRASTTSQSSSN